jgi:hypothetical protein
MGYEWTEVYNISMKKAFSEDEFISLVVTKSQARFKRIKNPKGADTGVGYFFMIVDVTAKAGEVLVPLSIASGKKTTGFMYQIEGTGAGALSTAEVSARGAGVTQVTLGTLHFVKIPEGATASFRVQVEIKGKIGKEYSVLFHQINYKLSASDVRYKKFVGGVRSRTLEFR